MLSILTPAYNEEQNLSSLYDRICKALSNVEQEWEWIIIDDHSSDGTFESIKKIAAQDARVRGLRFSKNFGSHNAYLCGLLHAKGNAIVGMSGDGQDPPEIIPKLLTEWLKGFQVVWAGRNSTSSDSFFTGLFSRVYYVVMRKFVGISDIPEKGADFFLVDSVVSDELKKCQEKNTSIFAMITWMGFRQKSIYYDRQERLHGSTGWTLSKKIKLLIDSIVGFSYLPIRAMGAVGALVAMLGLLYIPYLIFNAILGQPIPGWSELIIIVLILGGIQMLMLAVLGEYLWRTLEESRNRPSYLIEEATKLPDEAVDVENA